MSAPTCPDLLKLLVSDLITCWQTFKANQPKLHDIIYNSNPKLLADIVRESYIQRKMAFNELEHYQKHTKLLGEHPIFEMIKLKEGISALTTPKLSKKISSLQANLTRNRQKGNTELVTRDEQLLEHAKFVLENR